MRYDERTAAVHPQEPLQQTVRQVHCAFEALLDILEAQRDHAAVLGLPQAEAAAISAYLEAAALDIMGIGGSFSLSRVPLAMSAGPRGGF